MEYIRTIDPLGLAERKKLSGDSYFVKNKTGDRYQMGVPELKNTGSHNQGWDKTWRVSGYAVSPMLVEDPASLSAEEISKMREMVEDQYNADRELASAEANYQSAKELASLIPGASIGIAYVEEGPRAAAVEAGKEVALTAVGFGVYKYAKSLAKVSKGGSAGTYVRSNAPAVQRILPKNKNGVLQPDVDVPHTQLGPSTKSHGAEPQAREWMHDDKGRLVPTRDIDFTHHNMPSIHPNPHQHILTPANPTNPIGGGFHRGDPAPLK